MSSQKIPNLENNYLLRKNGVIEEFQNGETPLDEEHMNALLYAIDKNHLNVQKIIELINSNFASTDNDLADNLTRLIDIAKFITGL